MYHSKQNTAGVLIFIVAVISAAAALYFVIVKPKSQEVVPLTSSTPSRSVNPDTLFTNGVLRIKTDILEEFSDTVYILNTDKSLYGAIYSDNNEIEPAFNGRETLAIRSYYPDYYIIIMDAYDQKEGLYRVFINGAEKYVAHRAGITVFENWSTHLKNSFIVTNAYNPLRKMPSSEGTAADNYDYDALSFETIKVQGDWVEVICNMDCEGCPHQQAITGWLKWKDGSKLLIELYYTC